VKFEVGIPNSAPIPQFDQISIEAGEKAGSADMPTPVLTIALQVVAKYKELNLIRFLDTVSRETSSATKSAVAADKVQPKCPWPVL
jgi:hypothetical protein